MNQTIYLGTAAISGLCWLIVYVLTIKKDFADKTYGMPLAALAINFAWETRFSLIFYMGKDMLLIQIVNTLWMLFDIVIVYTFYKFGYERFYEKYGIQKSSFYVLVTLGLVIAFLFMFTAVPFFIEMPRFNGDAFEVGKFIAYGQNMMMSILFLLMFWRRRSLKGQSFYIALAKWLGTLAVAIPFLAWTPSPFMYIVIGTTEVFDIWYMVLLYKENKKQGLNPWKHI